ncbi:hypothetical protein RRG08_050004 [Elysia crispata]|uniref:EF-hand domain-containing protein n=1 Tax=Elysia crispata TaxID=231223 RepID=A0AAE1B9N8_9GAST|nr:hypothetical protein RRG08_050004 [Elysia crispata]
MSNVIRLLNGIFLCLQFEEEQSPQCRLHHVKVNQELGLGQQEKVLGSQEPMLEITIDRLLRDDDADGDGYISYTEYRISNRRYHKKSDS